jgi:hypothetical protein
MEFGLAPRSPKPAAARSLRFAALVLLVFFAPLAGSLTAHLSNAAQASDWRTARRDSAGIAPDPASTPEALIQVYAARAFRWRGAFAVHTWIAARWTRSSRTTTASPGSTWRTGNGRMAGRARASRTESCSLVSSLSPAVAAIRRNEIVTSAPRIAAPLLAIKYVAVRRITRGRTFRAVAMIVASLAVRMATVCVGTTGMWERGLHMRRDEEGGEQKIAE